MKRRNASQDTLSLKKALGHTILSNNYIKSSSSLDSIFYIAGSAVVRYSHIENVQKAFFIADKPLASIALSKDGRYLAAGERGHLPAVIVWDTIKQERVAMLKGHKNGIGALAFSNNGRYLVSVGFKPDKQLLIWNWREEKVLSTQKLVNKVHSIDFQEDDEYFVTAGDRHLKWWYLHEVIEGESVSVEGKPASIMEEHRTSVFVDIVCGKLQFDGNVYCTTASGLLCMFNSERSVSKWVQLESNASFCLQLFIAQGAAGLLTVGCASGTIRGFSPNGLEYIATLPVPPPMKLPSNDHEESVIAACFSLTIAYPPSAFGEDSSRYSDQSSLSVPRLFATYADRTMILWDINDIFDCKIVRETRCHHSCIWDVKFLPHPKGISFPTNTFATCSADNSVRFWNVDAVRRSKKRTSSAAGSGEQHLLGTIELEDPNAGQHSNHNVLHGDGPSVIASTATGLSVTNAKAVVDFNYADGLPDFELPDRPQSSYFPRTLSFHPLGTQLACGDKSGKLQIYDAQSMQVVYSVQAHSAEILSVAFSPVLVSCDDGKTWALDTEGNSDGVQNGAQQRVVLLATAGRDRLIHVFAAPVNTESTLVASGYSVVDTLDHHSASVTCVSFTPDGSKMISCGGDKIMVLYHVFAPSQITPFKTISTPLGSINDIQVDVSNKFLVTSGQDKRLNIWNLHSGKHMRAYRNLVHPDQPHAELFKTDIDPSGSYIVTVDFDKRITLLDFFSGEVIGQVKGHGELITNVSFSQDGSHIVTVGGDGVILVWQVADLLVKAMQDRLMELVIIAQRRNQKLSASENRDTGAASAVPSPQLPPAEAGTGLMPPPPPTLEQQQQQANAPSAEVVASSLTSLKLKKYQQQQHQNLPFASSTSTTTSSQPAGSRRVSRWKTGGVGQSTEATLTAAETDQDVANAYELHGRKVIVAEREQQKQRQLNKFTLELTGNVLANEKTWRPSTENDDSNMADRIVSPNVRAAEDADDVLVHNTGDDETAAFSEDDYIEVPEDDDVFDDDDGEKLFRPQPSSEPLSTTEKESNPGGEDDGDAVLSSTQTRLDTLQETLNGLEDWLESKLRGDAALDGSGPEDAKSAPANPTDVPKINKDTQGDGLDLSRSISAAFFQHGNVKKDKAATAEGSSSADNLDATGQNSLDQSSSLDQRRKENHLRLSAMRERLRAMGIVEDTAPSVVTNEPGLAQTLPPPPPPRTPVGGESNTREGADDRDEHASLYDTPSTVSHDELDDDNVSPLPPSRPSAPRSSNNNNQSAAASTLSSSSLLLRTQLREKQHHYLSVLRELDAAKENALRSYQELLNLRSSTTGLLSTGVDPATTASLLTGDVSSEEDNQVLDEADNLLAQYRQSLSSFAFGALLDHHHDQGGNHQQLDSSQLLRSSLEESVRASILPSKDLHTKQNTVSSTSPEPSQGFGNTTGSETSLPESTITAILERYSDRLVNIVGDKLVHKLATATPQKKPM